METKQVYVGIATVTRALGRAGISKDRKNLQQGYNYRGIDEIYNALNSELATAQLCIIPRVLERESVERQTKNGGTLFYTTIKAEFDIVSAVDGSMHTASAYGEAMDSGDKSTNKAMSAAYKYMAMQLFCIPTEGDNDADATTPPEVAPVEFDPAAARQRIALLPLARAEDAERAQKLTDRASLGALYKEVANRKAASNGMQ